MLKKLIDIILNESQSMKRWGLNYFSIFPANRKEREIEDNSKIDNYTTWLKKEIELMRKEEAPACAHSSERAYGMYTDIRFLDMVLVEHSENFDFIVHNYKFLMHTVPKDKLDRYFVLFREFEKEVNRFDSTYPASLVSSSVDP